MAGLPLDPPATDAARSAAVLLAGGGEMAQRLRAIDWSTHPLGPVDSWSVSLRVNVKMMLANRFPQLLWWGPDYLCLYNDAYAPILGAKHPAALGKPMREVWNEVWHVLQPLIDTPFHGGPATWMEDLAVEVRRHGYPEETHFTIAYSPVPDETAERGIGGVMATVVEITEKVVGERRLGVLRDLGGSSMIEAQTAEAASRAAGDVLSTHALDVPFALIYLIDGEKPPRIAGTAGIKPGTTIPVLQGERASSRLAALVEGALKTNELQVIERIGSLFDRVPAGPWPDPPSLAAAIPIPSASQPAGILIAGVSSRIRLDDRYRSFLALVASQIGAAITSARSLEEERKRAEVLAELDRAKTAFFSNVSHEFRTPLTLVLGPLEEALRRQDGIDAETRHELTAAHRNALRLLKLVNTLLEFSRIEAGRVDASYEKVDVGAFTSELASGFRSALERAGLSLLIDLPDENVYAYVDRDMWEKIVLNLVSNAFKHTFEGHIMVEVRHVGDDVCLQVSDTGVGIPEDQIPHLFERFYRVPNARTRAHEGTGIGLALVQELVGLHGGRIEVSSREGEGSVFTVRIPLGRAHLPKERIGAVRERASTALGATPYLEEALRWLPRSEVGEFPHGEGQARALGERILLADDNADMREYLTRLLTAQGWIVEAVPDGKAALASALRSPPDLVLSDVMMPGLDGFELVRELRADDTTGAVPVILLSARAAEEAKVEGLERGADDYLVKPFSANELVARVGAHLRLAEMRKEALEAERVARGRAEQAAADAAEANQVKSDFLAVMSHELRTPLNAIGGYAQLMEMGIHGPLTDRQKNDITRINEAQRHLLAMISKVLNYAKLDAGVEEYDIEDVPLDGLLAICVTMTQPLARAKDVAFHSAGCASEIVARADAEKVQQVVINLLSNAVKFTEPGGSLTVTCLEKKNRVYVRVTDTGRGIAEDQIERVFQPFVQLGTDRSRTHQGTGLGLAISRELAHGMGGNLTVESKLGEGSSFTLELPRAI